MLCLKSLAGLFWSAVKVNLIQSLVLLVLPYQVLGGHIPLPTQARILISCSVFFVLTGSLQRRRPEKIEVELVVVRLYAQMPYMLSSSSAFTARTWR